ncbi:MAG TPA: hypothetical protein P5205_05805 [Candidatus Paceibacterota bacterium]|nr:hypothetical protein [Verrucomicrobiota bacterium]HSA09868.1 hypothetical protein [Candidatus Paceibacterota bacterium]
MNLTQILSDIARHHAFASQSRLDSSKLGAFVEDWPDKTAFDLDVINTIARKETGLRLSRATGELTLHNAVTGHRETFTKYRLKSNDGHAYFDFVLTNCRGGFDVLVMMLYIEPEYRGNFFALRRFFIEQVSATLFGLLKTPVFSILGEAQSDTMPCAKLVKLYKLLGCIKVPRAPVNFMVLFNPKTQEYLERMDPPLARRLREATALERKRVTNPRLVDNVY